ncbi:hypothetical protein [Marinobacterium aestuariivivens]|uniref:HEAT repeat domain-containing protein n=1 Tax=Marinobacterium aestuariivivens TaxID=1698799 RepID=A0ABW1ZWH4_9GAMM
MFAKFFRPKWQSNKADVRIRAISRMLADNPEQQEILSRLAQTDQNIEVRKAALARLIRPEPLLRLLASELDPAIRHSASEHLCELITDAHSDLSAEQRLRCIEGIQDQDLLTHIALHSQQAQLQQAAVAKVRDESNLEVLALNAQSAQTRRLAAERLEAEEVLERIGRKVRQRDKAVYRITRDKLQQMRDAARALEELRARRLELVERFEQLAQGELLPQYAARIDALGQEWQKLEPGQDDLDSRYRQAVARCRSVPLPCRPKPKHANAGSSNRTPTDRHARH